MKSRIGILVCLVVSIILGLSSCSTPALVTNQNLSYIYNKEQSYLHPEYVVFNRNDSVSALYFRINSKELLFTRSSESNYSNAKFSLSFSIVQDYENKSIVDSGSVQLIASDSVKADYYYGYTELKVAKGSKMLAIVKFSDNNRNQFIQNFIPVDRTKSFNPQDIMVVSPGDTMPVFDLSIGKGQEVELKCNYPEGQTFFVELYGKEFPLPAPPFAIVEGQASDLKPDSSFYLPFDRAARFTLPSKGLYLIRRKPSDTGGFTLKRYYDNFPNVKDPEIMLAPLRFLSSKQEFKEISESPTRRAAIEKFWIECSGSQDRARDLIKIFYNRVKDSNVYFTSYLEGWKSDRGLIYLIFGPPTIVYRNSASEQWIYGSESSLLSLSFTFLKMENPFSDNDYSLSRNTTYKNQWYQAVDSWRQGRVWLDN
ncbi:MAG: GWxTD domain-containing protein [Bacteroidia bacterium]|nr:GWxTD domain-containing protein [Bacteroidia bacterium]